MATIAIENGSKELSAELLLSVFYPDIKEWNANYGSFFSRNYSGDLKSCDPELRTLHLARNGLYDILPEKMFFDPEELRDREERDFAHRVNEIYEEEKNIQKYFLPFDSFFFNRSLNLHINVNRMTDEKTTMLLKILFGYNLHAETCPYIRLLAPLLLQITTLRGDFERLTHLLTEIIGCNVDYATPLQDIIMFTVHKHDLDSKGYAAYVEELKPLFDFVNEWFIPMQMDCVFKVKDYQQHFVLSDSKALVLDYNTHI